MAFEIVNRAMIPRQAIAMPEYNGVQVELADQTGDSSVVDFAVAGLKHLRIRLVVKSGLTAGTSTFTFNVRVDTVVGLTSPEVIIDVPAVTLATGETLMTFDVYGWSQEGFQYFKVDQTTAGAGTGVWDAIVDAW
jgi:hypothetical protein